MKRASGWGLGLLLCCAATACGAVVADPETSDPSRTSGPTSELLPGSSGGTSGSSGESTGYGSYGMDSSAPYESPPDMSVDAGFVSYADSGIDDQPPPGHFRCAAAPLPPAQDGGGFNAIYSAERQTLYLPLFSTPTCIVEPPYGEFYYVDFSPMNAGPSGVFPSCFSEDGEPDPQTCYTPGRSPFDGLSDDESFSSGRFELSAFDANGIATGEMDTTEGIVPLAVKYCP